MFKKQWNATPMKHNIYPNLSDHQLSRLNKINEIKDQFVAEIKQRELMSKGFSKHNASVVNFFI